MRSVREPFLSAGAESLRWSAPESWHVTLQFLGRTLLEQAVCLSAQLAQVRAAPAPIRLAGLDFFPRAGVFFAGVSLTPELLALQQAVTAATGRCGFRPEERPYHPHITLARATGRRGLQAVQPLQKALARSPIRLEASFVAPEFLLYESLPTSDGSRYEVRARFPLRPSARP